MSELCTSLQTCSSCTEHCFMSHLWFRRDGCTLHPWKPCHASLQVNLFSHDDQLRNSQQISNGGETYSKDPLWDAQYPVHLPCMTQEPSQMQVPARELLSSLEIDGKLGNCAKVGSHSMVRKTLVGQKQSDLDSLFNTLYKWEGSSDTSEFMGITKGSLKDGGTAIAGTKQLTWFLDRSSLLSMIPLSLTLSTQNTSQARLIQLMTHPEESTRAQVSYSQHCPS
jgi:hypothetical protein